VRVALLAVVYTFVLGASLAAAFYLVGGRDALMGRQAFIESAPAIYGLTAMFAAVVSLPLGWIVPVGGRLMLVIVGAWLGEYVVLAPGVLDDDLNPAIAVIYWIGATGGPLQIVSAYVGAVLGGYLAHRPSRRE
jgi:hypothetical protein